MNDLRAAAQQALAHVQEFKRRWMAAPPFGNKVNKATREAVTLAHVPVLQLEEALRAALAQQAPHPDTIRLAYLYGGEKTASDALLNAQLRLLLGGALTLDEARAAIDDAIANPMMEDDHD
jgi:hypothetical protein